MARDTSQKISIPGCDKIRQYLFREHIFYLINMVSTIAIIGTSRGNTLSAIRHLLPDPELNDKRRRRLEKLRGVEIANILEYHLNSSCKVYTPVFERVDRFENSLKVILCGVKLLKNKYKSVSAHILYMSR